MKKKLFVLVQNLDSLTRIPLFDPCCKQRNLANPLSLFLLSLSTSWHLQLLNIKKAYKFNSINFRKGVKDTFL